MFPEGKDVMQIQVGKVETGRGQAGIRYALLYGKCRFPDIGRQQKDCEMVFRTDDERVAVARTSEEPWYVLTLLYQGS